MSTPPVATCLAVNPLQTCSFPHPSPLSTCNCFQMLLTIRISSRKIRQQPSMHKLGATNYIIGGRKIENYNIIALFENLSFWVWVRATFTTFYSHSPYTVTDQWRGTGGREHGRTGGGRGTGDGRRKGGRREIVTPLSPPDQSFSTQSS